MKLYNQSIVGFKAHIKMFWWYYVVRVIISRFNFHQHLLIRTFFRISPKHTYANAFTRMQKLASYPPKGVKAERNFQFQLSDSYLDSVWFGRDASKCPFCKRNADSKRALAELENLVEGII